MELPYETDWFRCTQRKARSKDLLTLEIGISPNFWIKPCSISLECRKSSLEGIVQLNMREHFSLCCRQPNVHQAPDKHRQALLFRAYAPTANRPHALFFAANTPAFLKFPNTLRTTTGLVQICLASSSGVYVRSESSAMWASECRARNKRLFRFTAKTSASGMIMLCNIISCKNQATMIVTWKNHSQRHSL